MAKIQHTTFEYEILNGFEDLNATEQSLIQQAIDSSKNAYAPYSGFYVGASVLLSNKKTVQGNNQENVAYPSAMCAERVALFSASAQYPDAEIEAIAIYALSPNFSMDHPVTPCGSCRQVMAEYELKQKGEIQVFLVGENKVIYRIKNAKSLLPLLFHEQNLKKKS